LPFIPSPSTDKLRSTLVKGWLALILEQKILETACCAPTKAVKAAGHRSTNEVGADMAPPAETVEEGAGGGKGGDGDAGVRALAIGSYYGKHFVEKPKEENWQEGRGVRR